MDGWLSGQGIDPAGAGPITDTTVPPSATGQVTSSLGSDGSASVGLSADASGVSVGYVVGDAQGSAAMTVALSNLTPVSGSEGLQLPLTTAQRLQWWNGMSWTADVSASGTPVGTITFTWGPSGVTSSTNVSNASFGSTVDQMASSMTSSFNGNQTSMLQLSSLLSALGSVSQDSTADVPYSFAYHVGDVLSAGGSVTVKPGDVVSGSWLNGLNVDQSGSGALSSVAVSSLLSPDVVKVLPSLSGFVPLQGASTMADVTTNILTQLGSDGKLDQAVGEAMFAQTDGQLASVASSMNGMLAFEPLSDAAKQVLVDNVHGLVPSLLSGGWAKQVADAASGSVELKSTLDPGAVTSLIPTGVTVAASAPTTAANPVAVPPTDTTVAEPTTSEPTGTAASEQTDTAVVEPTAAATSDKTDATAVEPTDTATLEQTETTTTEPNNSATSEPIAVVAGGPNDTALSEQTGTTAVEPTDMPVVEQTGTVSTPPVSQVELFGDSGPGASVLVGTPMLGKITMISMNSKPLVGLDSSKWTITPLSDLNSSSDDVTVSPVTDNGDGTYSFTLNSERAGSYTLTVAYGGQIVSKDIPFEFSPGHAAPAVEGTLSVVQAAGGGQSYTASVVIPSKGSLESLGDLPVDFSVTGDATFGAGLTSASVHPDSTGRASVDLDLLPYTGAPLTFTVSASVTVDGLTIPMDSSPATVTVGGSQECTAIPTLTSAMVSSVGSQPVADGVQAWTVTYALASSCASQSYSADQFDVRVFDASGNPTSDVVVGPVTKVSDTTFRVAFTSKVAGSYTVKTSWVAVGPAVDTITFSPATVPTVPVGPPIAPTAVPTTPIASTTSSASATSSATALGSPLAPTTAPSIQVESTTAPVGVAAPPTPSSVPGAASVSSSEQGTPTAPTSPSVSTSVPAVSNTDSGVSETPTYPVGGILLVDGDTAAVVIDRYPSGMSPGDFPVDFSVSGDVTFEGGLTSTSVVPDSNGLASVGLVLPDLLNTPNDELEYTVSASVTWDGVVIPVSSPWESDAEVAGEIDQPPDETNSGPAIDGSLHVDPAIDPSNEDYFNVPSETVQDTDGSLVVVPVADGSQSYTASVVIKGYPSGTSPEDFHVDFSVSGDATFGAGLTSTSVVPDSTGLASVGLDLLPYTGAPLTFTVSATVTYEGEVIPMSSSPATVTIGGPVCTDDPTLTSTMVSSDAQPVADGVQAWTATYSLASSCASQSYSADQFDVRVFDTDGNPTSDVVVGSVSKVSDTTFRVAFTSKVAGSYTVKTSWVAIGPVVDTITFSRATVPTPPGAQTMVPASESGTPTAAAAVVSIPTEPTSKMAAATVGPTATAMPGQHETTVVEPIDTTTTVPTAKAAFEPTNTTVVEPTPTGNSASGPTETAVSQPTVTTTSEPVETAVSESTEAHASEPTATESATSEPTGTQGITMEPVVGDQSTLFPATQTVIQSCDGTSDGGDVTASVKDDDGNPVEGAVVVFTITDQEPQSVTTGSDGTATVHVTSAASLSSSHTVDVHAALQGATTELPGSPAHVVFQLSPTCVPTPAYITLTVTPRSPVQIGNSMSVVVTMLDADRSPVVGADLSKLVVSPSLPYITFSPYLTVSPVTDNGDGTYSFTLTSQYVGTYTVMVAYDGHTAAGAPFSVQYIAGHAPPPVLGVLSVVQPTDGSQSYTASVLVWNVLNNTPWTDLPVSFSVSGDATFGAGLTSTSVISDSGGQASVGLDLRPYTGTPLTFTVSATVTVDGIVMPMAPSPLTVTVGGPPPCLDPPTLTSTVSSSVSSQPVADGVQAWTATYALASSCASQSYSADQFDVRVFDGSGNPSSDVVVGSVSKVSDSTFRVAFTSKVAGTYTVKTSWVAVGPAVDTILFLPASVPTLPGGSTTVPSPPNAPTSVPAASSEPTTQSAAPSVPTSQAGPTSESGVSAPVVPSASVSALSGGPTTVPSTPNTSTLVPVAPSQPTTQGGVTPVSATQAGPTSESGVPVSVVSPVGVAVPDQSPPGTPVLLQSPSGVEVPVVSTAAVQVPPQSSAGAGTPVQVPASSPVSLQSPSGVEASSQSPAGSPVPVTVGQPNNPVATGQSGSVPVVPVESGAVPVLAVPGDVTVTSGSSPVPSPTPGPVVPQGQSPSGAVVPQASVDAGVPGASGSVPMNSDRPDTAIAAGQPSAIPATLYPVDQTVVSGSSQLPTSVPGSSQAPMTVPGSSQVPTLAPVPVVPQAQPTSGSTVEPMSGTAIQSPSVAGAQSPATSGTTASIELSSTTLSPGQSVVVSGHGWVPGEQVSITVHSTPIQFPPVMVNPDGSLPSMTVAVPADFEPGTHTLTAVGSQSGTVTMSFQVVAAGGGSTAGTGGGSVAGASGGAAVGSESGQVASVSTGGHAVPAAGLGWLVGAGFVAAGLAVAVVRRHRA
ncbi:MAG: Ig-like domain-containing protein [Propionibacteriaceae bacterium]|nr:Ig-like domain-containing protein [Propionibacteriaceae bacterium]